MRSILNCNHVFWGRGQALAGRAASSSHEAANYCRGEWENFGKSVRYARMNDAAPADRAGELVLDAKNCREAVTGGASANKQGGVLPCRDCYLFGFMRRALVLNE